MMNDTIKTTEASKVRLEIVRIYTSAYKMWRKDRKEASAEFPCHGRLHGVVKKDGNKWEGVIYRSRDGAIIRLTGPYRTKAEGVDDMAFHLQNRDERNAYMKQLHEDSEREREEIPEIFRRQGNPLIFKGNVLN